MSDRDQAAEDARNESITRTVEAIPTSESDWRVRGEYLRQAAINANATRAQAKILTEAEAIVRDAAAMARAALDTKVAGPGDAEMAAFEARRQDALSTQVGGKHYKDMAIQPVEFIEKNQIPYLEGNAIKYICRHASKGGVQDIDKAIHYLQLLKEMRYGDSK